MKWLLMIIFLVFGANFYGYKTAYYYALGFLCWELAKAIYKFFFEREP